MTGVGPRIAPGGAQEIGRVNALICRVIGAATGGPPPHLFTTLARQRGLFRGWLRFAGKLMPGGRLPRADTEIVILRVAHNTGCGYERSHHEHLALSAGLGRDDVERTLAGAEAEGWSERQRLLIRAADELHSERVISSGLWADLERELSEPELIELLLLIGHYEMLAMTINSIQIEPDVVPENPPRLARFLQSLATRRAAGSSA